MAQDTRRGQLAMRIRVGSIRSPDTVATGIRLFYADMRALSQVGNQRAAFPSHPSRKSKSLKIKL
ncbi:hypothetical protein COLO4_02941 [Corchorus olitorius]|uniref:Uncharacterized protein n=1 Tax=Corchorus olitorius TaxID=93759 RepID=A0A1R3L012_9ROSI|nr:hypothetical protein COLO4_02941 [Corchorus olitorius]